MGKTAFALRIFQNATEFGYHPVFFSLEMGANQLATRIIASESNIELNKIRTKSMSMNQRDKLREAAENLAKKKFVIDDKSGRLDQILNKIRKYHIKFGSKLFIIDYLQLASVNIGNKSNREQEISKITRSLKELAREKSIVIIALSQLNREVSKRGDKRPMLSDLRESGSIEQDADFVIFPYRPAYYEPEKKPPFREDAKLIIAKGRSTGTATIDVQFIRFYTKYLNGPEDEAPDDSDIPF